MLHPILVLADRLNRTNFLARDRDINDGMVRTALVAFTTADTSFMINLGLTVFLESDSVLRAVHITTTSHATPAKIRDLIIHGDTRGTRLIHYTHDIFLLILRAEQGTLRIL